jgi:hypothetical protein
MFTYIWYHIFAIHRHTIGEAAMKKAVVFLSIVAALLGAGLIYVGTNDVFKVAAERKATAAAMELLAKERREVEKLNREKIALQSELASLNLDHLAAQTPTHMAAFNTVAKWKQVCRNLTLGWILQTGDAICLSLAKDQPLEASFRRRILAMPQEILDYDAEFRQQRCSKIEESKRSQVVACNA